jgi:hypothetical protein
MCRSVYVFACRTNVRRWACACIGLYTSIMYICPYVRNACYGMKCVDTLKNVLLYYVTAVSESPYSEMLTLRCACWC